ncbi:Aldehyde/histidinol dehydrogenase [Obelidium mucronatum]|nr:Aldehyde/histidinol dehydrogenase [Obelidium mucronatum]
MQTKSGFDDGHDLSQAHSKLEYGGEHSVEDCFITPLVVSGVKEDEIFGPHLGIVEVANENEAISIIKSRPRTLSMYVCTESKAIANKFLDITFEDMPFGGVGNSGMGKCHGHAGHEMISDHHPIQQQNSVFSLVWVYFKLWVIFRAGVFVGLEGGWVNVVGKIQKLLA